MATWVATSTRFRDIDALQTNNARIRRYLRDERERSMRRSVAGWTGQFEWTTAADILPRSRALWLAAGEQTGRSRSADLSE